MLRILHLEDDPIDAEMVVDLLREEGLEVESDRVDTLEEFKKQLQSGTHALILSDYTIPGVDAFETLRLARQLRPDLPFVFLSGTLGEDVAIEALKMGATDYVLKQRIGRLGPAVRRALKEAEEQFRRKEAEEALRRANIELERKVQLRTQQLVEANANLQTFTHAAAHDLRSPLRTIHSFTGLALEDFGPQLDPVCRSYLERVIQAAESMGRLMNDLLEYSRMEQAEMKLEVVSLQAATQEALGLLETEMRTKQASVIVEDTMPAVTGHQATVVLILNNLLSNALKFMAVGMQPRVRVWAEESAVAAAQIEAGQPGQESTGFVRLWVEDNGIGIPPAQAGSLFQVFHRLHGKQEYPGTGLGLAIVRRGAERIGGRVGVESEQGKGSRFWVELQRAP
jgi:signal transduction histidine kinase